MAYMSLAVNSGAIWVTSSQVLGYVVTPAVLKASALQTRGFELVSSGAPSILPSTVTACLTLGSRSFFRVSLSWVSTGSMASA